MQTGMIFHFFQLIRWPNLLMLAGIQSLVYFKLIENDQTVLTLPLFLLLVLITMLLGAGGYVINDYYDVAIDRINKPGQVIAGAIWSNTIVVRIYYAILATGALLSILFSAILGLIPYLFVYVIAATGLWFYSYALKCRPIAGNLWVSLFCAGVICILMVPDYLLDPTHQVRIEFWYYVIFAFLTTWYREIVKDIEDKSGDEASGCNTFVVKRGLYAGKIMALLFSLLLLASLLWWDMKEDRMWLNFAFYLLQGLTIGSMALVWWAKSNSYYHHASTLIKIEMLLGTALLLLN